METTSPATRYVAYLALDDIPRAVRNPKAHDESAIRASISTFGCTLAGELDERTGRLVAGHGRLAVLEKMRADGDSPPEGIQLDSDGEWTVPIMRGWSSRSDVEADAYIIASNRLTEAGGWDDRLLADVLDDIANLNPDLIEVTGYTTADLDELIASFGGDALEAVEDADPEILQADRVELAEAEAEPEAAPAEPSRGELLSLAGVTIGEPRHQVEHGQVWRLGEHHLVIADLFTGWPLWRDLLVDGAVFLPSPTALAPFAKKLQGRPLVMVQAEQYLAGHLLDKWENVTGQAPARAA